MPEAAEAVETVESVETGQTVDRGVDEIRQDLACPDCQYNLRGLIGAVISCPECGMTVNVGELVTHQWTRPWHKAPGYNRLAYPFMIALVGSVFAMLIGARMESFNLIYGLVALALLTALTTMIWITRENGYEAGLHCLVLIPLVIVGYLASLLVLVGGVIAALGYVLSLHIPGIFFSGIISVCAAGGVWISRKADRYIAGRCIARYLARRPVD